MVHCRALQGRRDGIILETCRIEVKSADFVGGYIMYRIGKEEIDEIARVIESKQLFRLGNAKDGHLGEVDKFEAEWAEMIGAKYALLNSGGGTCSLICALVGLGIGPGDEVIVPAYTFMATAVAVLAVGAIPVLAEIDDTLSIDPADVESKIGPNTSAIIPVHMLGMPADMERICAIARKHNIKVIEDACQADGGSFKGKRLGSWGDVGAFSFNAYKIISCGDGGGLVTDDPAVYEKALVYHDSGITFRPVAKELSVPIIAGLQMRASEIMGAIMRMQLQKLDGILADLRRIKSTVISGLSGKAGIRLLRSNDIEGDCGVAVGFQFDTEAQARAFATSPDVNGWLPIDSGRHDYCNWEPVMDKKAGAHPALNPYSLPQNQGLRTDYSKDMCPKTLDSLKRTVLVNPHADWSDDQVTLCIKACERAGKSSESL